MRRLSYLRKAAVVALAICTLVWFVPQHYNEYQPPLEIIAEFKKLTERDGRWPALGSSPFANFGIKQGRFISGTSLDWNQFRSLRLQDKCRWYFDTAYRTDAHWTNDEVRERYDEDRLDNARLSHVVERLRMYDACFVEGKLSLDEVLGPKRSRRDFHHRMFPFFKEFRDLDELWPQITFLNTQTPIPTARNPNWGPEHRAVFELDHSKTFWDNWASFSSGKGLVLTLGERHKDIFLRLLSVLDHLGNTLPIQLVQQGDELSQEFLDDVTAFLQGSNQRVYHVNCQPLFNIYYTGRLTYFVNKWLASIFNTFSEVILLDADIIPFTSLAGFFEPSAYQKTGIFLFKDRDLVEEHTFDYCIEMFKFLEPSAQAVMLMDFHMIANTSAITPETSIFANSEEKVFHRFFHQKLVHNVDSGLVVMNKTKMLSSLIMAFFMNLDSKISGCVYGDKELFWLAPLFNGKNYTIHPMDGAAIGSVQTDHTSADGGASKYQICSTQMGHVSENQELLWTNGGLKTCKVLNAAQRDFDDKPAYFEPRYGNAQMLQSLYEKPLSVEGFIIPDTSSDPWFKANECCEYAYCAAVRTQGGAKGEMAIFDENTAGYLNEISHVWNRQGSSQPGA
ncbi:LADA_0B05776g1_1 [Lachancea dasiensis]|uniref:LADA_0B05776g1_1 n=1 Tax=Lachancea dasiensis TaxID=1072105 RepID=A0A1G4ITN6_9SACH|nr:LADA_0B05776g1_1 [Lachancea dasiensis]